jgi:predicted TIM-barrel fold metal-dependent hydrolase
MRIKLLSGCNCCNRRSFVAGLASLASSALLPSARSHAQSASAEPHRIDVHHHIAAPTWANVLKSKKIFEVAWNGWSPAKSVEYMDKGGVATSIVSTTAPGVWFGDRASALALARECNDYAGRMAADHPGRFGIFGTLPLPDIDGSLKEIEYCLDVLKADGICLFTSYDDKYLGDPKFAPIFEELNRRKVVIYTHPVTASCCRNIVPDVHVSTLEYAFDTTRTIASLVYSGASQKYPDVRLIFSHAGGTMPFLIQRFIQQVGRPGIKQRLPKGVMPELKRFYYDTAQAPNRAAMAALKEVVSASQIVFGTDYPYRTSFENATGVAKSGVFTEAELLAIDRGNVEKLIPRYRT